MSYYIYFIVIIVIMIVSYMVINKKGNQVSYKNKYKENSIKISKNGFNDTRYIWGFEYVKGDEIKLLESHKISNDLIELYKKIKPKGENNISELGVGFDGDNQIKKVYFLEKDKNWGYGVKSDGKNVVYSKYEHKNILKQDLINHMFSEKDANFIIDTLVLQPDVKYYLKSDLKTLDLENEDTDKDNSITNSVHIALYERDQPIGESRELIKILSDRFDLTSVPESWYLENGNNLIDYVAFTKTFNGDIDLTIYYTKR